MVVTTLGVRLGCLVYPSNNLSLVFEHSMSTRISTLIVNKIFIWVNELGFLWGKLVTDTISICKLSRWRICLEGHVRTRFNDGKKTKGGFLLRAAKMCPRKGHRLVTGIIFKQGIFALWQNRTQWQYISNIGLDPGGTIWHQISDYLTKLSPLESPSLRYINKWQQIQLAYQTYAYLNPCTS